MPEQMDMMAKRWAFEDFSEGLTVDLGSKIVTAEEIVAFAREFDPQPFHLDEAAGQASLLGGLSASGWHTCCMLMRLLCDGFLSDSTSQGSPGIEFARWKKPVLAGDTLTGRVTILGKRQSRSKLGLGLVTVLAQLTNQRGEIVVDLQNTGMFLARSAA